MGRGDLLSSVEVYRSVLTQESVTARFSGAAAHLSSQWGFLWIRGGVNAQMEEF